MFNQPITSLLVIACTVICLFPEGTARAASTIPVQKLAISFDLQKSTMYAVSDIEFPANTPGKYHMDGLDVKSVRIDGKAVDLSDRSQTIFADKDHPLTIAPSPTSHKVTVIYEKKIPVNTPSMADRIATDGITLTGVWHPILHQDMRFELTAEIPAGFTAIAEAEDIKTSKSAKGLDLVHFTFKQEVAAINFIAGPYIIEKTTFGDNQELYTYFFKEDQDLAASYQEKTLAYLGRYIKLIGPYPYKRFSVVENRLPSGFAMPTFTLLGQAVVRLPFITDTSLGHEVLHEWFGNSIEINATEGNWAEGLTTYLADQQFAADRGKDIDFRKNQLIKYKSYVPHKNKIAVKDFLGSSSHSELSQKAIRAIGYAKTSMIFHAIKNAVGEEKFIEALRHFYGEMKFKRASWSNIAASFEKVTHAKMTDIFQQWLGRTDIPVIGVEKIRVREEKGLPVLSFTLRQLNSPPYELEVPISVTTSNEKISRIISTNQQRTKVEVPLTTLPRELVVDENYDIMRLLTNDETPPVWSRFEGSSHKVAILAGEEERELYQPLLQILARMNCDIKLATELTDKDVAKSSVIFLGGNSDLARSIFASPAHPSTGFTLDIRKNPLKPSATAILVSAANQAEVKRAARKLTHYGKYSYLHFEMGRIKDKRITPTTMGQHYPLDTPPKGVEIKNNLSFDQIMDKIKDKRVVYIGESHTRNEDHILQLRVVRAMYEQNPNLAIGMEMFIRASHSALDKYITGDIDELQMLKDTHYFSKWGYDYRFYQPIINFARRNRIPIIPLNLEKEIVSKVYKANAGLSGLDDKQKVLLPGERDLDMPEYRDRIAKVFKMHGSARSSDPEQLNNFLQAQSLWDETMAESVAEYLAVKPNLRMAVIAGRGHVDKLNAIPPRVARRLKVEQTVIINVEPREVDEKTADFLVFSPPSQLPLPVLMGVMLAKADVGVKISKLSPHGNAKKAGIKENDIFLALDDQEVNSIEDIKLAMFTKKKGEKVRVKLKRVKKLWPDALLEIEIPL